MTAAGLSEGFSDRVAAARKPVGVYGVALAIGLSLSSVMLVLSAPFAIADDGSESLVLLAMAGVCGGLGVWTLRRPFEGHALRPVPTMTATVCGFLTVAAVSTVVYLLTGTIDDVDDALYESVTGVSTSALTIFADPGTVGDGVLVWRSATQWIGGLGALALAVGLLPFLGGSRELADPHGQGRNVGALAPRPLTALRRVSVIYGLVTVVVAIALVVAGMGLHDAVAHALSSVSTGGFSTHADSIGHFDSVAIELVMIVVMGGAGSSVALVWMVWRGNLRETRRAFEVKVYCAVMALATVWIWWLRRGDDEGAADGLREALFTVVSVVTTTGHRVADWGSWHPGASALLLILLVVGGTAGSVAGGLRWIRIIGMAQFVWRELQRQLHPRSVRTVKVGSATISEASVDRMHAQMVYVMTLGAFASLVLALFGEEITESITLTISAISTTGPGFNEVEGITSAAQLSKPERAVLMPITLTGRVFLYPAFVAVGTVIAQAARALARARS